MPFKLSVVLVLMIFSRVIFTQDDQKKPIEQTKLDNFVSKTGVIIKYNDFKLEMLKGIYSVSETRVSKVTSGGTFFNVDITKSFGIKKGDWIVESSSLGIRLVVRDQSNKIAYTYNHEIKKDTKSEGDNII